MFRRSMFPRRTLVVLIALSALFAADAAARKIPATIFWGVGRSGLLFPLQETVLGVPQGVPNGFPQGMGDITLTNIMVNDPYNFTVLTSFVIRAKVCSDNTQMPSAAAMFALKMLSATA